MAIVTGLTADRMKKIEAASIVSGRISGDSLILTTFGGEDVTAGHVRGPQGFVGPAGVSLWLTTLPITQSTTENITPINIPGRTLALGDYIMSTHPSSMGYFGRVVANSKENNATLSYVGNLRGPTGGSQEEFDNMFSVAIDSWVNNTKMSQGEGDEGVATTPKLLSASVLRAVIRKIVTGSASTAVSSIGQALNRAASAEVARTTIGAPSATTVQQSLNLKPDSDDIDDFKVITRTQYNNLATKNSRTMYFVTG